VRTPVDIGAGIATVTASFNSWKEVDVTAVISKIKIIKRPEASSSQLLTSLKVEGTGAVHALAYSSDGKKLAAVTQKDGTIQIWNTQSWKVETELPSTSSEVYRCAFLEGGEVLATAHYSMKRTIDGKRVSGKVRLWDLATGQVKATLADGRGIVRLAASPNGRLLATNEMWNAKEGREFRFATRVWDVSEQRVIATIGTKRANVEFSADSKMLATAGEAVELWDPATGEALGSLPNPDSPWPVPSVAFASKGNLLAGGNAKGKVFIWDVPTRTLRATLTHGEGERLAVAFEFSPDGRTLAVATFVRLSSSTDRTPTIDFWNTATAERKATFIAPGVVIWSLTYDPSGRILSTGGPGVVWLWNTKQFGQR